MNYYYCISGCAGRHDIFTPVFSCPHCGGLVDVGLETDEYKKTSSEDWKGLIAARHNSSLAVDQSGVWAHREWVMPRIRQEEIISMGEGRSPLTEAPFVAESMGLGRLLVKQCGQSLTGSFKDLGMTVLVSMANAMRSRGQDVRALVCASTGDTSAALAAYGARAQIPVIVLLPEGKISMAQLVQPLASGAHVLALDGDFDQCMEVVQELVTLPGIFLANSKNPLRLEGQKTVAFEIAAQLGWRAPDVVAVPSGNLGNVSALYQGFSLLKSLGLVDSIPRLVACQVDAANPLFRAYETGLKELNPVRATVTHASAIRIGNPVSWPRAKSALEQTNGFVTSVGEDALLQIAGEMDRAGFFVCPHTATALAGVKGLAEERKIGKEDEVVVISTAHGLKFAEQKISFHEDAVSVPGLELSASTRTLQNKPIRLQANLGAVQNALASRLKE
jgi:threonine synthase